VVRLVLGRASLLVGVGIAIGAARMDPADVLRAS
jgi:hypothetical protein